MFPKGKTAAVPSDTQAKEKLASYVYEYLVHIGAAKAAQMFLQEIHWENKPWQVGESPGFLSQWWCVFYDLYSAAPERRETFEHSSEAKAFHDYGFVNSGFPNGIPRNPSISPISGGIPTSGGGRPPSSQGILPPDSSGIHPPPVSIQGGPMMVPGSHFFAPGHPMPPNMDIMRNRAVLHQSLRFPGPPQGGGGGNQSQGGPQLIGPPGYPHGHPGHHMQARHRFIGPPPTGVGGPLPPPSSVVSTSPGASSTLMGSGQPQSITDNPCSNTNSAIAATVVMGDGPSSNAPGGIVVSSISMDQHNPSHHPHHRSPAPAFPPPPSSSSDSISAVNSGSNQVLPPPNTPPIMNGSNGPPSNNGGGGQTPAPPHYSNQHTMEYMPTSTSYDPHHQHPHQQLPHHPQHPHHQLHKNSPNQNLTNATSASNTSSASVLIDNNSIMSSNNHPMIPPHPPQQNMPPPDFCNSVNMSQFDHPSHPNHPSHNNHRMPPISQIQMMQSNLPPTPNSQHNNTVTFMSQQQQQQPPISGPSPQFPDYVFTSMSQVI